MKSFIALSILLLYFVTPACAVRDYCIGDKLNNLALNGLLLRDAPRGNKILNIPYAATVKILANPVGEYEIYDHISGQWVFIAYGQSEGYVFDGFLSWLPAPGKQDSTFDEYLKRYFKQNGQAVYWSNLKCKDGEPVFQDSITYYTRGRISAEYSQCVGWEWDREELRFNYLSQNEAILLASLLFRTEINHESPLQCFRVCSGSEEYESTESNYSAWEVERVEIEMPLRQPDIGRTKLTIYASPAECAIRYFFDQ